MSKLLARSKSLRLRPSNKEPERDPNVFITTPQTPQIGRSHATPNQSIARRVQISQNAMDSEETRPARPRTAGATAQGTRSITPPFDPALRYAIDDLDTSKPALYTTRVYSDAKARKTLGAPPPPDTSRNTEPSPNRGFNSFRSPNSVRSSDSAKSGSMSRESSTSRPKLSRWRSLGGLFARKSSSNPPEDLGYQSLDQGQNFPVMASPVKDTSEFGSENSSTPGRKWHGFQDSMDARVHVERSFTSPVESSQGVAKGWASKQSAGRGNPGGPMLTVEIPNVEMERYSVMFGSVIKPAPSPSLLARRQGNGDRVNPLRSNPPRPLDLSPQSRRRATSPSPARSPSLPPSLVPDSGSSDSHHSESHPSTIHRPRPLLRSNTAPGLLTPNQTHFADEIHLVVLEESMGSPHSNHSESHGLLRKETMILTPMSEASSFHSFKREEKEAFMAHDEQWESEVQEWPMVTAGTTEPENDVHLVADGQEEAETAQPVVQLARSMSVTRAKRRIVQPRLVEPKKTDSKRPVVPTIVELERNRKSHTVEIETA